MKIFSVYGISGTGKTTTIENIIVELRKRNYNVGTIKDIHFEDFAIDTEGTNTDRHRQAGSQLVTAWGLNETDILYQNKLSLDEILKHYHHDYVIIEGLAKGNFPRILTAAGTREIDERINDTVIAISGRISNEIDKYQGIPVINTLTEVEKLVDLIEEKVFTRLPDFPAECCSACGYSCEDLAVNIIKGKASREDCIISDTNIKLTIDGQEIEMVPFVQRTLLNTVKGVVSELKGYNSEGVIEIKIGEDYGTTN